MTRDDIIQCIKTHEPAIRAEGVEHLAIFGSRARGDGDPDSDLDVLITLRPDCRFSLINLSGVSLIIGDATGLAAQVVLDRSAPPDFRRRIADDLVAVF